MNNTMVPTIDEVAADAVAVAREFKKPGSLGDWAAWYGVSERAMAPVLAEAVAKGVVKRIERQTGRSKYDCWVDVEDRWMSATLTKEEAAVWQYMAREGEVVRVSMNRVSQALGIEIDRVWCCARKLQTRGVLVRLASSKEAGNTYRVRMFA